MTRPKDKPGKPAAFLASFCSRAGAMTMATFAAMQNPYRNATMHLDQKYTEEEAKHVFEIVKGFMTKLASRCDENGDPKA